MSKDYLALAQKALIDAAHRIVSTADDDDDDGDINNTRAYILYIQHLHSLILVFSFFFDKPFYTLPKPKESGNLLLLFLHSIFIIR